MYNKKKKEIATAIFAVLFIISSIGVVGLFFVLPFIAMVIIYFRGRKRAMKDMEDGRIPTKYEIKKYEENAESWETAKELYSESEQRHLATMRAVDHDSYEHYKNELNDLLEAGIIDKDEYRERLAKLRGR